MPKSWEKILVASASLLMFASVGAGLNSSNANAAHVSLGGGVGPVQSALTSANQVRAYEGTFRQHGFTFNERHGAPANVIVGIDGDYHVSNHQVMEALRGKNPFHHHYTRHYRRPVRRHYRKHARKHYRRLVKKAKKHAAKKRTRKPRRIMKKVTAYKSTKNKTSHKVANFRKSAYYHNIWINALRINQKALHFDLKNAAKYSKDGNMRAAKKANRSANHMRGFVKRDQAMINLGK